MKTRTFAATALLLLVLTGCAGTPETATTSEPVDSKTATSSPEETETPLVAETPESSGPDADYLATVRDWLPENTVIPDATDAQLIAAGKEACAQLQAGTDIFTITVIEGEQTNDLGYYESSAKIASAAQQVYCPEG